MELGSSCVVFHQFSPDIYTGMHYTLWARLHTCKIHMHVVAPSINTTGIDVAPAINIFTSEQSIEGTLKKLRSTG